MRILGIDEADQDVHEFIGRNFYVDDGLVSYISASHDKSLEINWFTTPGLWSDSAGHYGPVAVDLIQSTRWLPIAGKCWMDLSLRIKNLKELDTGTATLPMQRRLGLLWNTDSDRFTFKTSQEGRPFTRRGVLSVINSLFDPLGFAAPVVVTGKLLMPGNDWDEPLPPHHQNSWLIWVASSIQARTSQHSSTIWRQNRESTNGYSRWKVE